MSEAIIEELPSGVRARLVRARSFEAGSQAPGTRAREAGRQALSEVTPRAENESVLKTIWRWPKWPLIIGGAAAGGLALGSHMGWLQNSPFLDNAGKWILGAGAAAGAWASGAAQNFWKWLGERWQDVRGRVGGGPPGPDPGIDPRLQTGGRGPMRGVSPPPP